MTTLQPGQMRLFDHALPRLRPTGTGAARQFFIEVGLDVDGTSGKLATVAQSRIEYDLVDPGATALSGADILAVYPPAGAEDAADVMLPHIALRARTFPWANGLPNATPGLPWIALLLFVDEEATFQTINNRRVAQVKNSTLQALLPTNAERELLCHVRELSTDDPVAARDDDAFVAIVIGNRLPIAGKSNRACLVDLRPLVTMADPNVTQNLLILHEWTFNVGSGGDFEAHFVRLRNPADYDTGGVVAFGLAPNGQAIANDDGELALAAPTSDNPNRLANYAGPCIPLPRILQGDNVFSADEALAVRGDGRNFVTYSAAFELGRLLALSNTTVLPGLVHYRDHQYRRKVDIILDTPLQNLPNNQPAFRGSWKDIFTDIWGGPWMPNTIDMSWTNGADPTGLRSLVGKVPGLDQGQLAHLAQLGGTWFELALTKINMNPVAQPTTITAFTAPDLGSINWFSGNVTDVLNGILPDLRGSLSTKGIDKEGLP